MNKKIRINKPIKQYNMAMVKVYGGSEIMAQSVQAKLEEAGIETIIKDNIESATLAGFGSFGQTVQIFVEEADVAKAEEIINSLN